MNRVEESLSALQLHRLPKYLLMVFMFSLIFSVLFSAVQFANIQPVYGYGAGTLYQSQPTLHEISAIAGAVTNPLNAYDNNNATSTTINYGYGPAGYYQLVTFDIPAYGYSITQVDFKMRYSATANGKGETYEIGYYVGATVGTTTLQGSTGAAYALNTRVWTNVAEPNDGTWSWTDVSNIKFRISISAAAPPVENSWVYAYEAWVTVHFTAPDQPTVSISPSNVTNYAITPNTTVTLRPDANGTYGDWENGYDEWNDITPDGDASYVYTDYPWIYESSTLEDASATETWNIAAVRVVIVAKGISESMVDVVLVIGGTAYYGKTHTLTEEYSMYASEWSKNPATGSYWTWSGVNATEAGVGSRGGEVWVTQLYVEVVGSRLAVNISVDYVENLWGFQFELLYDPNVIRGVFFEGPAPFEMGPFLGSAGGTTKVIAGAGWNNTIGRLSLTGGSLVQNQPQYCPEGGGVIAIVVFDVVHFGETEIRLGANTGLKDNTGAWIIYGQDYVDDGYFRNTGLALLPTASFTSTPVGTPVPLEGYDTTFTSTSTAAGGRTITAYKWSFWEIFRSSLFRFPTAEFRPDGDGTYTGWTGNYVEWDEEISDGDATYVKATADALYESSTLEDHTTETWPILKVRLIVFARTNLTTSDEEVRLMLVIGGTRYEGSAYSLGTTYQECTSEWETNPATGAAWNWSSIDALQAGVASEQVDMWTGEIRASQLYIEVIPAPIVTSTATELWNAVTWNYTRRGVWNVTLTVVDDHETVGTHTGFIDIKAHDVAIVDIQSNVTKGNYPREMNFTDLGDIVELKVTIENEGDFTEDTSVSCFWSAFYALPGQPPDTYYGPIGGSIAAPTAVLALTPGEKRTLTFYWDTTGRNLTHPLYHNIHANASRVQYEYDVEWFEGKITDNEFRTGDPFRVRFHDVAVTKITSNATAVYAGEIVEFKVTVVNQGDYNQTGLIVKLYNETDVIGSYAIPLMTNRSFADEAPGMWGNYTATLTYIWDTTDLPWANYTITAEVTWTGWATEDYEPHDNTLVKYYYVKIPGDVDGDGDVDGFDLTYMCGAYGATPGHPKWDDECDINGDDIIDGFDLTPAAGNYGKHI